MTDGIIQEVFKKFIEEHHFAGFGVCEHDVEILQQELIEKIKQEFPECERINCFNLTRLIGDNQE